MLDRVLAVLLTYGITAENIGDTLGVSESTVSHLKTNLAHHSRGRRQAAERLRARLLQQARVVLQAAIRL